MWLTGLHLTAAVSKNSLAKVNFKHVSNCLQFIRKEFIQRADCPFPTPDLHPHLLSPAARRRQGGCRAHLRAAGGIRAPPGCRSLLCCMLSFQPGEAEIQSTQPGAASADAAHPPLVPTRRAVPSLCCEHHVGTEEGAGGGGVG